MTRQQAIFALLATLGAAAVVVAAFARRLNGWRLWVQKELADPLHFQGPGTDDPGVVLGRRGPKVEVVRTTFNQNCDNSRTQI